MAENIRIGITERGDAGIDLSWVRKTGQCNGVIAITKNLTSNAAEEILKLHKNGYPCILHATCTGWGATRIEPNVPRPENQIQSVMNLIHAGFPMKNVVLRIDPIIPSEDGLNRVHRVVKIAMDTGLDFNKARIRISVLDEYRHVKARLQAAGLHTIYPGSDFYAKPENFRYVTQNLREIQTEIARRQNIAPKFRCCAEPALTDQDLYVQTGCVSDEDLAIMGLNYSHTGINPQNRNGCKCLQCKYELLENRHRCPHQCIYCYWKD